MSFIAIGLGATAIGAGIGAYGAISSGVASNRSAKAQAQYMQMQRKVAEQVAATNIMLTERDADTNIHNTQMDASFRSKDLNNQISAIRGTQKAVQAQAGVGGGSVTTADIELDTLDKAKMDEIAIRYNADAESAAIRDEANRRKWQIGEDLKYGNWGSQVQEGQVRAAGRNAQTAGYISAASTIMSAAGSMAMSANKAGLGGKGDGNQGKDTSQKDIWKPKGK
jgi:hypothetical protein